MDVEEALVEGILKVVESLIIEEDKNKYFLKIYRIIIMRKYTLLFLELLAEDKLY